MTTVTATYSAEDNKLRLYASSRLDSETYSRVKAAGYKWAPKQGLFVAPAWSCNREDLAIELAGEIEAEETTIAERAEAKAERLEVLAEKRRDQSNAFSRAAQQISERFYMGQPILVGHHSERKARKDHERADNAQRKAVEASKAVGYWLYKASSAQHHANRKNRDDVRARRIKTLLAELRDLQRKLNHAALCLEMFDKLPDERLQREVGNRLKDGDLFYWEAYTDLRNGVSFADVKAKAIGYHAATLSSRRLSRNIEHTLNRLGFEREMLGEVPRYEGEVTPVMLQEFVREHGAASPKGSRAGEMLTVRCEVPLPAHIGQGCALSLTADHWRDLMQACGYEATAKAAKKAASKSATVPLLNLPVECGPLFRKGIYGNPPQQYPIVAVTKAKFQQMSKGYENTFVVVSVCGKFRFRVGADPASSGGWNAARVALFISDSKAHALPKVEAVA